MIPQSSTARPTRREWLAAVALLALLGACALRPSIRGNDGHGHYVYLASLLGDGDLDFADDYRDFDARRQYSYRFADLPVSDRTGRPSNRYGIGAALLWAPLVVPVWLVLARTGDVNPLHPALAGAVGMATLLWGSLGLLLLYARLRRRWPVAPAAGAILALLLATPLGFYLYAHGSMSHGVGFFAVAAALLLFERAWRSPCPRSYGACGALLALIPMIRFQDAVWVLILGGGLALKMAWEVRAGRVSAGKALLHAAALAAGFLLAFLPQMFVWRTLYGSLLSGPMPYLTGSAGAFSPWPRHLLQVLVSERAGVLAWHPLILFALAGLAATLRDPRLRLISAAGLTGFLLTLLLVASWSIWWAGASFGNRFFIGTLPALAFGAAWWLARPVPAARRAAWLVLGLLIIWNLGLLVQYAAEMVPREDPVPWSQVIRQNLIDVPQRILNR